MQAAQKLQANKDNAHSGIFMYGGNVDVQDGTALTITGTGNSVSKEVVEGYYIGALAIRTADPANAISGLQIM